MTVRNDLSHFCFHTFTDKSRLLYFYEFYDFLVSKMGFVGEHTEKDFDSSDITLVNEWNGKIPGHFPHEKQKSK